MRSMVEGCNPIESGTPLRQAFGLPPPLQGEELLRRSDLLQPIAMVGIDSAICPIAPASFATKPRLCAGSP